MVFMKIFALIALIFALLAPVASAHDEISVVVDQPAVAPEAPSPIANESLATDGLLWEAVGEADRFWASKGYSMPEKRITVYDERGEMADSVAARGELCGPKVLFERKFISAIRKQIKSWSRYERRSAYKELFLAAAHERGHNLCFTHEMGGIMGSEAKVPGAGVAWAIKKAR